MLNLDLPQVGRFNPWDGTIASYGSFSEADHVVGVAASDFNGDGLSDYAISFNSTASTRVALNQGNGTFSFANYSIGTATSAHQIESADRNNDGRDDIIVAGRNSRLAVLLNNGDGTFAAASSYSAIMPGYNDIAVGDINGDGYADIAAVGSSSSVSVLTNQGNGSFSYNPVVSFGYAVRSVALGDIDGDGKSDLVASSNIDGRIALLRGQGNGSFITAQVVTASAMTPDLELSDIDRDGDLDVVGTSYTGQTLDVFMNNAGILQARQSYATGAQVNEISMADFNHDGYADVAASDYSTGKASIFLNDRNGVFSESLVSTGYTAWDIDTGDFNGDGAGDVISAGGWSDISVVHYAGTKSTYDDLVSYNLSTAGKARLALDDATARLDILNQAKGILGATQSRLEAALGVVHSSREQNYSARERIMSADIAEESATTVRNSILQQEAAGVLAQASMQPQIALTLLKG